MNDEIKPGLLVQPREGLFDLRPMKVVITGSLIANTDGSWSRGLSQAQAAKQMCDVLGYPEYNALAHLSQMVGRDQTILFVK